MKEPTCVRHHRSHVGQGQASRAVRGGLDANGLLDFVDRKTDSLWGRGPSTLCGGS
jgi:hypothetical protein